MDSTSARFSRDDRLTRPQQFQRVFAAARRSADRLFTVLYLGNDQQQARVGFAIARKKIPRAVDRNRVRRVARESFRRRHATLGAIDIIILPQPAAARAANAELFASLETHWHRLQGASRATPPTPSAHTDTGNTHG